MEIKELSGEKLLDEYIEECINEEYISEKWDESYQDSLKQELLLRLKKNNKTINFYSPQEIEDIKKNGVEEFKKKLEQSVYENYELQEINKQSKETILNLINKLN